MFGEILKKRWFRSRYLCPVCGDQQASFAPLPPFFVETASEHGFPHFDRWEMLSLQHYQCNNCGASDRERLYALWLNRQIEQGAFAKGAKLLHFAPEGALSKKIQELDFFDYKTADLMVETVDYNLDIMDMPFADESFDVFICSHVLEHVESDERAIAELFRITGKGGCGILVAPILTGLERTEEDPGVQSEAERWKRYGQYDHVRLYAHQDYVNRIRRSGFVVDELGIEYFGEKAFQQLGLTASSVLYVVSKCSNYLKDTD